jgi:hypothetical protein
LQEAVFESLADYFFEKIVFINLAYSDLGGGGTTSTTNYDKDSRIIDTAEGRLMAPGRESRLRCQFYLKNPEELDGYILSPSVYDSQDTSGITTSLSPLRSYVGLKFLRGDVFAVTKEAGGKEKLFKLDLTLSMYDSQFTDTYALEIRHNNSSTEIVINGQSYGSFSSNLVGSFTKVETFYPFFSPARSTDGTSVNIVSENIQFIQSR